MIAMMNWLPVTANFDADLRAALGAPVATDCLAKLASLSGYRLGFRETIQLDRALERLQLHEAPGFASVKLAILSSLTVNQLQPAIRVAGLRRKMLIDVHVGSYGQYRQDLFNSQSSLHRFKPKVVLFSLTAREVLAGIPIGASLAEVDDLIAQSIGELRSLWRKARDAFNATIVQQTFINVAEPLFGNYDQFVPSAPKRVVARLNDRLAEAAREDGALLLDIASASERDGINFWFDIGHWLHGKLEIAPQAAPLYGDLLVRIVAALRGLSKKCLVLDLDNTLWGGVIGDDGLEGIKLGEGSAVGEAHLALQRYAKQLSERGIILAVCSKNEPRTAEAAFDNHPEMLLKRRDIAAFVANWNDKAENLKLIANKLNIGVDSLVFVDDNPVERARIRERLPMVAVPELPDDVSNYVSCLAAAGYFEAVAFTTEDRQRVELYAAEAERGALLESSQSMDDFLAGLKMSVAYDSFTPVSLTRVVQLINKTNQFNTTTRRYSSEEVSSIVDSPEAITLQFRLIDRFGDNGLVSAMIMRQSAEQPDAFEIENWVMSCRVFGREFEFEIMNIAVEAARERGARSLLADYVATSRNDVIKELYPSLGFANVNPMPGDNGATRWVLDLTAYRSRATHIARSGASQ